MVKMKGECYQTNDSGKFLKDISKHFVVKFQTRMDRGLIHCRENTKAVGDYIQRISK